MRTKAIFLVVLMIIAYNTAMAKPTAEIWHKGRLATGINWTEEPGYVVNGTVTNTSKYDVDVSFLIVWKDDHYKKEYGTTDVELKSISPGKKRAFKERKISKNLLVRGYTIKNFKVKKSK